MRVCYEETREPHVMAETGALNLSDKTERLGQPLR